MRPPIFRNGKKTASVLIHASAWILYGSFIYLANYLANPDIRIAQVIFFLVPHCLTFYTSLWCLGLYKKLGIAWSMASFFIVFAVMAALAYCYIYVVLPMAGVWVFNSNDFRVFLKSAILGYVQYFSYALLYFYMIRTLKKERELRLLREEKLIKELENAKLKEQELKSEKEKLLLEYAFLRAQLNPHFLHNTLNTLFSQALEYSQALADNISRLSRMMRYSMENAEAGIDRVPVMEELDNLRLLIEINGSRFQASRAIAFSIQGEIDGQLIPPLAMITVVENAFKYGDLHDPAVPMVVSVVLKPKQVYFLCRNKKRITNGVSSSTNIGIANLRKRLDLAFRDRYSMSVCDSDECYTFELIIKN